uniref:B-like cyclin n=1 Tax=Populus trichocarpa TaxID=3694 RepID=A0A3N7F4F2_POPTR
MRGIIMYFSNCRPQVTIATAIIFCHRFFLRQSHAKNDRRTIATVCMFLAGKVEETPRPLKDVILVSYEIIHKKDPEAVQRIKQKEVYEQQKEIILLGERVVLATLGFDFNLLHPYKPLVDAIKKFKVAQNALAQVAWNFVNDGLRTSLCLQFKPHHIAAGAIFLAAKFLKVKLPSDGEKVWWQEFDVTPRQLEEVSNQMLELYEQNRVPPSANSEAEGSIVDGASHLASSKASSGNEEQLATNSPSHTGGISSRPRPSKPMSKPVHKQPHADNHVGPPRTSQNHGNDHGSAEIRSASDHNMDGEPKDDLHHEREAFPSQDNMREGHTFRRSSDWLGNKDQERNVARSETKDLGESKDKHFGRFVEHREGMLGQSPQDAIKKIDKDKVKAALEKRRKSRGDITRKTDFLDEDDLIERELEDGIELAAESEKNKRDRRQSWSKPLDREEYESSHHGKNMDARDEQHHGMRGQLSQRPDRNNIEDGELSAPDDMYQGFPSPKSSNRKRKASSPPDRKSEGEHRTDNAPGSHHYNHHDCTDDRNRMNRFGYLERDHKRHVPENHA